MSIEESEWRRSQSGPSDADTTIVKTALHLKFNEKSSTEVEILADEADILCLLIHHSDKSSLHGDLILKKKKHAENLLVKG